MARRKKLAMNFRREVPVKAHNLGQQMMSCGRRSVIMLTTPAEGFEKLIGIKLNGELFWVHKDFRA